jgi:very-short-patch-repair endonuclease
LIPSNTTTAEAIDLYLSLKRRGVPAELEKFDGFKTIDIAVVDARVNIEVDGLMHNSNHKQALADLKRTCYSFQKGYFTLRIPNALIRESLEETADYITDFLMENKNRLRDSSY